MPRHDPNDASSQRASMSTEAGLANPEDGRENDVFHLRKFPTSHRAVGIDEEEESQRLLARLALPMYEADVVRRDISKKSPSNVTWRGSKSSGEEVEIRTDRFDAIHLLMDLPAYGNDAKGDSNSETGFSELDSDTEDVFFLEDEEWSAHLSDKQRRHLEQARKGRVMALAAREQDGEQSKAEQFTNGTPPNLTLEQFSLMKRTAEALKKAKKPSVLAMRILANHGSDPRFAFLRRGKEQRWRDVWSRVQADVTLEFQDVLSDTRYDQASPLSLQRDDGIPSCSLVGTEYTTDSDEEADRDSSKGIDTKRMELESVPERIPRAENLDDAEERVETEEQRRKRRLALAHEWTKRRKEGQAGNSSGARNA